MGFLLLIIIVTLVVLFIIKGIEGNPNHKPVTPPSADVTIIGCQVDCGYFVPKFKESSNGDYDFVKKTAELLDSANIRIAMYVKAAPVNSQRIIPIN